MGRSYEAYQKKPFLLLVHELSGLKVSSRISNRTLHDPLPKSTSLPHLLHLSFEVSTLSSNRMEVVGVMGEEKGGVREVVGVWKTTSVVKSVTVVLPTHTPFSPFY